jgi:uncharacterized protein
MIRVYLAESTIHGTGVFAAVPILPWEIVLRINDSRVVTNDSPLDAKKGEVEHHCDYLAGGKIVLMQPPERFINHSCDPNTYTRTINQDRYAVSLREIKVGDEITYDYCLNSEGDTAWDCNCGSPRCRKRHLSGFFHLPLDVQTRYFALLEAWYLEEHRVEIAKLQERVNDQVG